MLSLIAVAAMMVCPAFAAEKEKKGKRDGAAQQNPATVLMKQLADVGLTNEQTTKIKEMGKKIMADMKAMRDEAGITPEITKKIAEAQKSMKDSDQKGKGRMAAIHAAAGLSEAQIASITKVNEARMKFQKDVVAMLTEEQKAKLPEQMTKALSRGGEKAKGKKKKDAA
jgi:Spy/CpxP family protein refolding chaperone